jgi:hypothetical protein
MCAQNSTEWIRCTVSPGLTVATWEARIIVQRKTSLFSVINPSVPWALLTVLKLLSSSEFRAPNSTIQRGVTMDRELLNGTLDDGKVF